MKGWSIYHMKRKPNIQVPVNNDDIIKSLRKLRKLLEREGITRDIKRGVYFESETQKKRKRKLRAKKQERIRQMNQNLI